MTLIGFTEAMARMAAHVSPLGTQTIALAQADGRILAQDIIAQLPSPRRTISAMDGYAVRQADADAGAVLRVIGEARPGQPHAGPAGPGEAIRIFTGAAIPEGADCVIMQEYAVRDGADVRFAKGYGPARHIRHQGSDFEVGDILVAKGQRLGPRTLVAAAAADVAQVSVGMRPKIALLATGDELAEPGSAGALPNAIPDSISLALSALISGSRGYLTGISRSLDNLPALQDQAGKLLEICDAVVVCGGASVGAHDFAKPMFKPHGLDVIFDKVAIKPGKPVWLGTAKGKLVLGLPGNPTSALVTARLFLMPLLSRLQGGDGSLRWRTMPLAESLPATGSRETFARARWEDGGLRPLGNQDSGVQGGLAHADWLIRCPPYQAELPPGHAVQGLQF